MTLILSILDWADDHIGAMVRTKRKANDVYFNYNGWMWIAKVQQLFKRWGMEKVTIGKKACPGYKPRQAVCYSDSPANLMVVVCSSRWVQMMMPVCGGQ